MTISQYKGIHCIKTYDTNPKAKQKYDGSYTSMRIKYGW